MAIFTVMEAFEKFLFVLKWSTHTPTIINMYERVRTPHIHNIRLLPSLR